MKTSLIFTLFLPILLSFQLFAQDLNYYNELYDQNGNVRPQYEKVFGIYNQMTEKEKAQFLKKSLKDFKNDNALDPLPRLITESEFDILKKGILQRGTALRMFLQDYHSGNERIYQIIPKTILEKIVARSHETLFREKMNPDQIAFPYGPDIMRKADGTWAVIEDNPGYIGGIGDLEIAYKSIMQNQPLYQKVVSPLYHPEEYYKTIAERARKRSVPKNGKLVMYMVPPYPDNEDMRLRKLYSEQGFEIVTPNSEKKLVVKTDGVFLENRHMQGNSKKVGFIIFNVEHNTVDITHPAAKYSYMASFLQERLDEASEQEKTQILNALELNSDGQPKIAEVEKLIEELGLQSDVKEVEKKSVPGLMNAILKGQVASNYSPGIDFIGDKEFYVYVDDMVRFYLKEEPLVKNLAVVRMSKKNIEDLLSPEKVKNYVFKNVGGRGGDGVWIGPKMDAEAIEKLKSRMLIHPTDFIAQPYTHLSVVDGKIVDLRMITDVGPQDTFVSRTPWGRGLPMSGDGKVNLSAHGREFTVMVVPDPTPKTCSTLLKH